MKKRSTRREMLSQGRALLEKHALIDHEGIDGWQVAFCDLNRELCRRLRRTELCTDNVVDFLAGLCVFKHKVIFIDKHLPADDFEQTMLHEIAHALVGRGGHGNEWKKVARMIGYKFGPFSLETERS